MHLSTRQLLKDPYLLLPFLLSVIGLFIQTYLVSSSIPVTSNPVVIRLARGFGPTQIGEWWELFIPYLIIFWCILTNTFFSFVYFERSKLFSRFVSWFSLALVLLLGIYTYLQISTSIVL